MDAKLILVEGLMGAGKSTTAQKLWLHLRRLGHDAKWFFEDEAGHPLWNADEHSRMIAAGRVDPVFLDGVMMGRWRRIAAGEGGAQVVILEGALTMVSFLLAMAVPFRSILQHVLDVQNAVAGLKPVVVYLRQRDAVEAFRKVCRERSTSQFSFEENFRHFLAQTPYGRTRGVGGFAALADFNGEVRDALELLLAELRIPKLALDVFERPWADCERQLADFLQLPEMQGEIAVDRPSRYLGRYRDAASQDGLVVGGDERGLFLDGAVRTRLIASNEGIFQVAAMPAELSFSDEREGWFQRIDISGRLPGLSPVWMRQLPAE